MNKDSNFYTFLFSLLMVLVVASSLALTSESLKEKQNENVVKEKMQNIISTIGVKASRDEAQDLYKKYIKSELSLLRDGTVDENKNAFLIDLSTEIKKDINQQIFNNTKVCICPGKSFFMPEPGYVRICYGQAKTETILIAFERMHEYLFTLETENIECNYL